MRLYTNYRKEVLRMIKKVKTKKILWLLLFLGILISCQRKENISDKVEKGIPKIQSVPNAGDAWRAVKLLVKNKNDSSDKGRNIEVEIGGEYTVVPNSKINIKVDEFYPDFFMDKERPLSKSTSLYNPTAHIIVEEEGKPQYQGFLFAKFPEVHALPNEEISIILVDYVKK